MPWASAHHNSTDSGPWWFSPAWLIPIKSHRNGLLEFRCSNRFWNLETVGKRETEKSLLRFFWRVAKCALHDCLVWPALIGNVVILCGWSEAYHRKTTGLKSEREQYAAVVTLSVTKDFYRMLFCKLYLQKGIQNTSEAPCFTSGQKVRLRPESFIFSA